MFSQKLVIILENSWGGVHSSQLSLERGTNLPPGQNPQTQV